MTIDCLLQTRLSTPMNTVSLACKLIDQTSSAEIISYYQAIYTLSGSSAGIGFAIPVDTLKYEVNTLIRDGRIVRPVIGVTYLESAQAKSLGINKGILVLDVGPKGSPARMAGMHGTVRSANGDLELGDIITAIDGKAVSSESDLFSAIE